MKADEIGNTDYIAVVVSKKPIEFNRFNASLNASRQSSYAAKLKAALGSERILGVNFKAGQTVAFDANTNGKNAVGMVIAIDKN